MSMSGARGPLNRLTINPFQLVGAPPTIHPTQPLITSTMSSITYAQAKTIATKLTATPDIPAAQRLAAQVKQTGKMPTFFIMRYGDPKDWPLRLPKLKAGRPRGVTDVDQPFTIQNLETGQRVTSNTIVGLLEGAAFEKTRANQIHMAMLRRGNNQSLKGWYPADVLDTSLDLKDIYGNEYQPLTIRELALTRGVKPCSARALLTGKKRFFRGLALKSTEIESDLRPRNWRFASIRARVGSRNVRARSIKELADKVGTDASSLYAVAYGFKDMAGITIQDVQIERKAALPVLTD